MDMIKGLTAKKKYIIGSFIYFLSKSDGVLHESEGNVIVSILEILQLDIDELVSNLVPQNNLKVELETLTENEKEMLLGFSIKLIKADNNIDEMEKTMINKYFSDYGYNKELIDVLLKD